MTANIDPKTGIRYGVVSLDRLADWVWDEFLTHGMSLTHQAAVEEFREEFFAENPEADELEYEEALEEAQESWQFEEEQYTLETDGMKLELSYLGGAPLVFVIESPHTSKARQCSPCVPNAGDLDNKDEERGYLCYDVPADWYETEES